LGGRGRRGWRGEEGVERGGRRASVKAGEGRESEGEEGEGMGGREWSLEYGEEGALTQKGECG